jgi:hypothetical protein
MLGAFPALWDLDFKAIISLPTLKELRIISNYEIWPSQSLVAAENHGLIVRNDFLQYPLTTESWTGIDFQ